MKTTIDLPEEVVLELKLRAVRQSRAIKDVAADLLRQSLGLTPPPPLTPAEADDAIQVDADGFPSFRTVAPASSSARAKGIDALLKIEQDALTAEDLSSAGISV